MKICKKCGGTEFYASGSCKPCQKERSSIWRSENEEKVKQINKAWHESHRDHMAQYRKKRYEENRERILKEAKEYRESHRESKALADKRWKENNPEKRRRYKQNRKASKKYGGILSPNICQKLFKLQKGLCTVCRSKLTKYHIDHIMPLVNGGLNTDDNVQLLCPPCNLTKGSKHPIDFMQSKGYLL